MKQGVVIGYDRENDKPHVIGVPDALNIVLQKFREAQADPAIAKSYNRIELWSPSRSGKPKTAKLRRPDPAPEAVENFPMDLNDWGPMKAKKAKGDK
jgi:hypothetical protein